MRMWRSGSTGVGICGRGWGRMARSGWTRALTADAGAGLLSVVKAQARTLQEQARRAGSKERADAYAADALVSLGDSGSERPRAAVHVHVDQQAWERGRVERGESCGVAGLGPVSVAAARRLARDGIVK